MDYPVNAKVFLQHLRHSGELKEGQQGWHIARTMLSMVNSDAQLSAEQAQHIANELRDVKFWDHPISEIETTLAYCTLATYINSCRG